MTTPPAQDPPRLPSWRDAILNEFVPHISRLTLVADPDGLLTEEQLALELRKRGFDLIEFTNSLEFRYAYEAQYRSLWDRGEHADLVVILRSQDAELESLPYDLLQAGRKLSFTLGSLFPNLSYPVIHQLDRSWLDPLFAAQKQWQPDRMGDHATQDFVLRHVFRIAPELIDTDVDLLRTLLRLHYGKIELPAILSTRLIQSLQRMAHDTPSAQNFNTWPLETIIPDAEAFFAFLQERWPFFLSSRVGMLQVHDEKSVHHLTYEGPHHLPFDHEDIKIYIDNLFAEGQLSPIEAPKIQVAEDSWIRHGILTHSKEDDKTRFVRLFDLVQKSLPSPNAQHSGWLAFALKWAELASLAYAGNHADLIAKLADMGEAVQSVFSQWLTERYSSLINLPPNPPAMVHHVPRYLARSFESARRTRLALIVVDGLALDQWVTIRQHLQKQVECLVIRESATFAWIPTLTSVSRQSLFAGKPPFYFPNSIHSTHNDAKLWHQFWEGYGFSKSDILYQRGLGNTKDALNKIPEARQTKVLGLVVDTIDRIMHGMQLGTVGMHNQINQWCQNGFLSALIDQLLELGYKIWLTADHGNIQCDGIGQPREGVIAETRGERARVYPTEELRAQVAAHYPSAHLWQPVGLPANYFPLIANDRNAFVTHNSQTVAHGGFAMEEVIVPLIKFERRTR